MTFVQLQSTNEKVEKSMIRDTCSTHSRATTPPPLTYAYQYMYMCNVIGVYVVVLIVNLMLQRGYS